MNEYNKSLDLFENPTLNMDGCTMNVPQDTSPRRRGPDSKVTPHPGRGWGWGGGGLGVGWGWGCVRVVCVGVGGVGWGVEWMHGENEGSRVVA